MSELRNEIIPPGRILRGGNEITYSSRGSGKGMRISY